MKKLVPFGVPNLISRDIGAELFKTRTFRDNWDEGDTYANVNFFLYHSKAIACEKAVTDGLPSHRFGKTVFVAQMKI